MQPKMAKEQESGHEESETNNKTSMKYRNNEPAVINLLVLAIILANIELSYATNYRCLNPKDIARFSNITHKFVGCTPCPPCPPGKEYSIPCGTKAYAGTKSECIPCPIGKYSKRFDTKPCVSCTLCTNKVVKQNCTPSRNSVCGDFIPGYYLEDELSGCLECAKCCHDGQDEIHPSCSAVNLCKPRPSGCPVVPTTKLISTPYISPASPSSAKHNQTLGSLSSVISAATAPEEKDNSIRSIINTSDVGLIIGTAKPGPSLVHAKQSTQSNEFSNTNNPWFIVFLVFLVVVVVVVVSAVVVIKIKLPKWKRSSKDASSVMEKAEYELVNREDPNAQSNDNGTSITAENEHVSQDPKDRESSKDTSGTAVESACVTSSVGSDEKEHITQDPSRSQLEESEGSTGSIKKTLNQFVLENFKEVDRLSKFLYKKKQGLFDFQRVAKNWKISEEDELCIEAELHAQNGSPVRKLLEALCGWKPRTTVKEFADSIKDINENAYGILKPHFFIASEEKDRIVD